MFSFPLGKWKFKEMKENIQIKLQIVIPNSLLNCSFNFQSNMPLGPYYLEQIIRWSQPPMSTWNSLFFLNFVVYFQIQGLKDLKPLNEAESWNLEELNINICFSFNYFNSSFCFEKVQFKTVLVKLI